MKTNRSLLALLLSIALFTSCSKEKTTTPVVNPDLATIASALDSFANTLQATPPTTTDLGGRIHTYLAAHSTIFYGSTVTLLDSNGKAWHSPYYFRKSGSIDSVSLMAAAYKIDSQSWLRKPIDSAHAVWTEPYFDAGGGEIWMRTRSVPIYMGGKIFAVATTDLPVDKP